MKTIYSMGKGKYVHMDSYPETHETRLWSIGIAILSITIGIITATSAVGIDITNPNSTTSHHDYPNRTRV